jgi:hypothetical protein
MPQTLVLKSSDKVIEINGSFDKDNEIEIDINIDNGFDGFDYSIWITIQQAKEIIEHLTTCLKEHEEIDKKWKT